MLLRLTIIPMALLLMLASLSAAGEEAPMPEQLDAEGFRDVLARTGDLYIAGQPEEAALAAMRERGVTTVINLRTSAEMDNRDIVPFDEAAAVAALGMNYVHIPSGGEETPYAPAQLDAFAAALADADGPVLLHCTVAWRASHLWTAYLVRHRGMSLEQALEHGHAINFRRLPVEGFLGEPVRFSLGEEP